MSSKKQEATDLFYNLFTDFLKDLHIIRPGDNTLYLVKSAVYITPKSSLVYYFMDYIKDFSDKILEKDETFFLNNMGDYIGKDSFINSEFLRIKEIWLSPTTTKETKETIWNYLICLVKTGKIASQ